MLTQYKSHTLDRHITKTWRMSTLLGNYVTPGARRSSGSGPRWFAGSADAIYQSLNLIDDERPDYVIVFGADHIYRMDPQQMVDQHIESGAGVTVAGIRQPLVAAPTSSASSRSADDGRRISAFREKPTRRRWACPTRPTRSSRRWATTSSPPTALIDAVQPRRAGPGQQARHGRQHHPDAGRRAARRTSTTSATTTCPAATERDRGYWRDVGTLDAFYDAHMDLISVHPVFNLYNSDWPIYTGHDPLPPAKFVHG